MSASSVEPQDETIALAARWLANQPDAPQPIIPTIRTKFGLTTAEACAVCHQADRLRGATTGAAH